MSKQDEDFQINQDYDQLRESMKIPNPFSNDANQDTARSNEIVFLDTPNLQESSFQKYDINGTLESGQPNIETARTESILDYFSDHENRE